MDKISLQIKGIEEAKKKVIEAFPKAARKVFESFMPEILKQDPKAKIVTVNGKPELRAKISPALYNKIRQKLNK